MRMKTDKQDLLFAAMMLAYGPTGEVMTEENDAAFNVKFLIFELLLCIFLLVVLKG